MVRVAADTANVRGPRTYGNWRRPTSPGLIGLGSVGTAMLLGGLIVVVITVMVAGLLEAVVMAAVLGAVLLTVLTKDSHGKNLLARGGARAAWWSARSRGTHLYRSGPLGRAVWGTYQLPGLAAPTRLSEHSDSYGRRFALLHTPATGNFSVIIGTEPDGAALVDQEQIDVWVADWGHWLANLADEPGIEAASVTIETAPDSGTRLRREVEMNIDPEAPAFARQMLTETVQRYPSGSSTVKAFVAITFAAATRAGGKKRTVDEMGRELAARMPGLTQSLQATGAGAAHPLSAQELCETIRVAYDPAAAVLIDEAHAAGETPELSWPDVGPSATEAAWNGYRHDSAYSCTWAMTSAPRGNVQSGVLARLLAPHRDIARKRVTLLYRPIDPAKAAAMVESDLRAAEFRQTSTSKPAARDVLAVRAAAATASEEASGAGLVNFGVLVTATVMDGAREADARAAIDNLSATARLRLRPVYGSQDSAFAAALPLGLILTKHVKVPAELRDKL
nr:SCO6880 family protein [Oerskovia sp. Root22]